MKIHSFTVSLPKNKRESGKLFLNVVNLRAKLEKRERNSLDDDEDEMEKMMRMKPKNREKDEEDTSEWS